MISNFVSGKEVSFLYFITDIRQSSIYRVRLILPFIKKPVTLERLFYNNI